MKQTLASCLASARAKAGLTIRQLETMTGISHGFLIKLELGKQTNPSPTYLIRLAEALEVDADDLLRFIGVEPSKRLPSPRVYFRRKYGLSETATDELLQLVEEYTTKQEEGKRNGKIKKTSGGTE